MVSHPPILVYRALMEDVKKRTACLHCIASGTLSLGDDRMNWELAALQLRMVLESIAFASLSAHRGAYSRVHAKFTRHWKAALLVKELAAIHPKFYPQPMRFERVKEGGVRHFARVDGYLTQDEFVELYDVCSQLIHMHNPFGELKPIHIRLTLADWIGRIHALLDTHFIEMHGIHQVWVVQMASGPNNAVQVAVAEPTPAA
jgi:hypothetical protein